MSCTTRRYVRVVALALVALLGSLMLAGCNGTTSSQSTGGTGSTGAAADKPVAIKIGTLATEDSLPLWVAEKMGYFSTEGIPSVQIIEFQSAQERDTAFASGAIDAFMGDIIAAANLESSGKKVSIATVMLGADPTQGRFGIVASPKTPIGDPKPGMTDLQFQQSVLKKFANVPIGTSSATIQEYVLDGLMSEAGVPEAQVKTVEVKKVPVRFQLVMADKIKAAALPEPFLTLAAQSGANVIGDDTMSKTNLSQTVLVFSDDYLAKTGGKATESAVLKAWDAAANDINKSPENYRALLVEKARVPKPLVTTYKMQTYPMAAPPKQADVDAVLAWMTAKGYLKGDVTYSDLVTQ
jgi:NitT/TauT family transport system substrate-binding protein